jgi:hypothetical protein
MIAHAISRQQNDSRTPGYPRINRLRSHATFQFTALFTAQLDRRGLVHHSLRSKNDVMATRVEYGSMISKALRKHYTSLCGTVTDKTFRLILRKAHHV